MLVPCSFDCILCRFCLITCFVNRIVVHSILCCVQCLCTDRVCVGRQQDYGCCTHWIGRSQHLIWDMICYRCCDILKRGLVVCGNCTHNSGFHLHHSLSLIQYCICQLLDRLRLHSVEDNKGVRKAYGMLTNAYLVLCEAYLEASMDVITNKGATVIGLSIHTTALHWGMRMCFYEGSICHCKLSWCQGLNLRFMWRDHRRLQNGMAIACYILSFSLCGVWGCQCAKVIMHSIIIHLPVIQLLQ